MNEELRQRMIDSVSENSDLTAPEKETSINMTKPDDEISVFSSESSVMKRLLAHPAFEIGHVRQKTSDGSVKLDGDDLEAEFDGRRATVAVDGSMPVGALMIKSNVRGSAGHAKTVSAAASDLRLKQDGGN